MDDVHPCRICGALVAGGPDFELSALLHTAWHALLERRLNRIDAEAQRYKPPPTYR